MQNAARCRDMMQYPCVWKPHTQQMLHHMTSPLVSVLFVPSLHSYHFCRKFLIFSSIYTYVVLGHGANLCRVQNGQNGRPLRSRCVRLKYSLRTALNEKEIVRNEAYTPTFPPGKDTGIGRRNIANSSSFTLENSQDPKRSTLQITPIIQCPQATKVTKNTQQHNRF